MKCRRPMSFTLWRMCECIVMRTVPATFHDLSVYEGIAGQPMAYIRGASHGANDVHRPCMRILLDAAAPSRPIDPKSQVVVAPAVVRQAARLGHEGCEECRSVPPGLAIITIMDEVRLRSSIHVSGPSADPASRLPRVRPPSHALFAFWAPERQPSPGRCPSAARPPATENLCVSVSSSLPSTQHVTSRHAKRSAQKKVRHLASSRVVNIDHLFFSSSPELLDVCRLHGVVR